jgi:death on curing protein
MINLFQVERLHTQLIEYFGGASGVRDYDLLLSALARPYQTFDNSELIQPQ